MKRECLRGVIVCLSLLFIVAVEWPGPVLADRQVASTNEVVPLSGSGAAGNMLQFKAGGHILGFQPNKAYLAGLDHALSIEFLGTPGVMPTTDSTTLTTGNITKATALSTVLYKNLWDNINLTYESTKDGITESTYHVAPGGDVTNIRLRYNVPVELQAGGSLKFKFDNGYLIESSPVAWQEIGDKHLPVTVAFRVSGCEVGLSVGQYDRSYPLIIDPTYVWHTFYGSGGSDITTGIVVDTNDNVYVTGLSYATWNGPAGQSPLHAYSGGADIFVLKLNSSGAYQWHSFYGSSGDDVGYGIVVDSSANVYIAGYCRAAWNGPTGQSPLHAYSGGVYVIFVLKLDSSGTYQWHTFYGYTFTVGYGIAIDGSGNVYVTGYSRAPWNDPTGQSPLHAYSRNDDIFVLKLNSSGTYQWHTFYGSIDNDQGRGVAVDGSDNVYVTGHSYATWNGPTGQSPLHAYSGNDDIFVLKLNSSGTYQWHTFYGSSLSGDQGFAIAVDGSSSVYVTGYSHATWNGPTGQSPLHDHNGGDDTFVLKLNSSGAYQWHTFYGSGDDYGFGIAADASGNVYVMGYCPATWNGPTGQSPLNNHSGGDDIFMLKLNSSGAYQWHTFYGSSSSDRGSGIAVDAGGNVYVTGYCTGTWGFPLNLHSGNNDILILKMSDPHPVLSVSPASRDVVKDAGTTTFSVSNTGTETMPWTAAVISDGSWLSITSGVSGVDTGTITCAFDANTGTSARTGTIRVTATGATGTPKDVTVKQAGSFDIGLTGPGWNLTSLPQQPSDTAISNVLGNISGKYTSAWAYQNNAWKVYDSASPGFSDLSTMETGWGYWLNMTQAATLSVTGTEPSKTMNLIAGWNLVGFNSSTSLNITSALTSIAGKVISVWAYKNNSWQFYDPAIPGFSDLTTMGPGYGYWINTNVACTWTLP